MLRSPLAFYQIYYNAEWSDFHQRDAEFPRVDIYKPEHMFHEDHRPDNPPATTWVEEMDEDDLFGQRNPTLDLSLRGEIKPIQSQLLL